MKAVFLLIKFIKGLIMFCSCWQSLWLTARLLGATTAAFPVLLTLQTPATQTAALAAGWEFGLNRLPTHLKTSATRALKCHCRSARSFPPTREVDTGLRLSRPGNFRKSAVRAHQTVASPLAAIPRTLAVSPPTQAVWIWPPERTLVLF